MIRAGDLRHRLRIDLPCPTLDEDGTIAANAYGEPQVTFTDAGMVYASVIPLNAHQVVRARTAEMETTHVIGMRYTPKLTAKCRLTLLGNPQRRFTILSLINVGERNVEWQVQAAEVADA